MLTILKYLLLDHLIEEFDLLRPDSWIGSLKDDWHIVETRIIDKALEKCHTQCTFTYFSMSVDSRAKFSKIIVQVQRPQIIFTDYFVEFFPSARITFSIGKVLACRIYMASINTNSDSRLVFNLADDMRKMLESMTEIASLSGCRFEDSRHSTCLL